MNLKGVTLSQFRQAVSLVNVMSEVWPDMVDYNGNLAVHQDAHEIGIRKISTVGRLTVVSSSREGARRSWQGRKCQAACWHAFRDVIRQVFVLAPDAVVKTSMATYTAANFEATYPATGWKNIGSQFQPVTMPELCDC